MRKNQSGSAIIMLFIAAALFGALAYAFMQGSRTSTGVLTDEQAKTYAQQIIAYGNDIKGAVKRLTLRGYKDTQIGFDNDVFKLGNGTLVSGTNHNANCTTDACKVFAVSGGGLVPKILDGTQTEIGGAPLGATSIIGGHSRPMFLAVTGVGTAAKSDLLLQVHSIPAKTCAKINEQLGVNFTDYLPPTETYSLGSYNGTYTDYADQLGDGAASALAGKLSFCARSSDGTRYNYYTVLLPR